MTVESKIDLAAIAHLSYEKRHPLEIIQELKTVSGRNDKLAILLKAKGNDAFVAGLRLTYHPRIRFYIRQIPEYKPAPVSAWHPEKVLDRLKSLYQREVTGNAAIKYLLDLLESTDEMTARFVELIIARDLDCGVSVGSINKVHPNLIPTFPVQLCNPFDDKALVDFPFPAIAQTKMDGMRCTITVNAKTGAAELFLRNGNSFDCPPDLAREAMAVASRFKDGSIAFDGELTVAKSDGTDEERKTGNGILTRLIRETATPEEIAKVRFNVWDAIPLEDFWNGYCPVIYQARLTALLGAMAIEERGDPLIRFLQVRTEYVGGLDAAKAFYEARLGEGLEGAVLKNVNAPWKSGRQKWCLKLKAEDTIEAEILGIFEGKGKYADMLGGFSCVANGDIFFEVGSGFSDAQRKEYWHSTDVVGKTITVQYNQVISSGGRKSLYLPVFIELRADL